MKLFKKAVLVIHGFSGSYADNEFLINELETVNKFDVYFWTLPAHEKTIINKVKYQEWLDAVDDQIKFLIDHGYKNIYVVGHSMGGLLSSYLASKYKEVKKVVFLSAAFDYISTNQYKEDFKLSNWKNLINDIDVSYKNFFHKLIKVPFTTAFQFRKLVTNYRECIKKVKQECLVIHGDKDEVVPYIAMDYIRKNIKSNNVTFYTVENGRHIILRSTYKDETIRVIKLFLIGGLKWKLEKKKVQSKKN